MEGTELLSTSSSSFPPSPVLLSDCLEELVRFTLSSSLDGTLEVDLCLSGEYISGLIREDRLEHLHPNHKPKDDVSSGGVPLYPLYKRLAWALGRCIRYGAFLRGSKPIGGIAEVESLKGKENEWSKLVVDTGSELKEMFKAVEFELHVQEPFFSQLRAGLKNVEGRCAVDNYNRIAPSALLLFNKSLLLKVQHVKWYSSFSEMLEVETLINVLPGVKTIEEGIQIYRKFYREEKEKLNGVVAIAVSRPASQPYILIAKLLSGLSYEGIGGLLGVVQTVGTVPKALPPPRSALISSFILPHRPNVAP